MTKIESPRRFAVIETGEVVAIYDQTRAYTLYAPVGEAETFAGEPRTYWPDELTEL